MAGVKFSAIVAAGAISGTDTIIGVQTGPADVQYTVANLTTYVATNLGAASGTSLALNGATIGTNALAVTGTVAVSGSETAAAFIPTGSTIPTNGVYLPAANTLGFAAASALKFGITGGIFYGANGSSAAITNTAASSTAPSLIPNRADTTTGIGAQAAGNISFIAGGFERVRVGLGTTSVADILFPANLVTGGTGTTNFPQIFVQPTGTTAVTTWSTSGTILGANVVSGFAGNFLDFHVAGGGSIFNVTSGGTINTTGNVSISSGNGYLWNTRSQMLSPADGQITLLNAAASGFTRLNFGGTTSSFPALRRSGTALDVVLADDSGYAQARLSSIGLQGSAFITTDGADIVAQRNSTTAQTLRVYNTYTDSSNYERATFDWSTAANTLTIGTQAAGTGTARNVSVIIGGTERWRMTASNHTASANVIFGTDNTYDIGASGASRPRTIYAGTSLLVGNGASVGNNVIATALSTAIPAGGLNTVGYKATTTANFGVFFGSGAPTLSAAKGSLYLRSDGSTTNDRMYVNTDGGTTWTAVITAA